MGPLIYALAQESRICRAAAICGGISGGTPNYDVEKPALIQMLSPIIRILFAHQKIKLCHQIVLVNQLDPFKPLWNKALPSFSTGNV
jgi:hypothetical protein